MSQIFISYKRIDKDKVFRLVESIENQLGCQCWVDLEGVESSAQFSSVLCRAIDQAEVVLFMHSSAHLSIDFENDWTVKELNYAQLKKKRVVLVKLDNAILDNIFLLEYGSKNNIDSQDPVQFKKLINDLRGWLQLPQPEPANTEPFERTWKIGDYYNVRGKEGVVFWVDQTGKHGKIVSLDQTECCWRVLSEYSMHFQIGASDMYDGMANKITIMKTHGWYSEYRAVAWCFNYGIGWYLPSVVELLTLMTAPNKLNETLKEKGADLLVVNKYQYYWSSTEYDNFNAFYVNPFKGVSGYDAKELNMYVRAVCAF